jgi:hypothetical protein
MFYHITQQLYIEWNTFLPYNFYIVFGFRTEYCKDIDTCALIGVMLLLYYDDEKENENQQRKSHIIWHKYK